MNHYFKEYNADDCAIFVYEYVDEQHIYIRYSNNTNLRCIHHSDGEAKNLNVAYLLTEFELYYMKQCIQHQSVVRYSLFIHPFNDIPHDWFMTLIPHVYRNRYFVTGIGRKIEEVTSYLLSMMSVDTFQSVFCNNEDFKYVNFIYDESSNSFTILAHGNNLSSLFDKPNNTCSYIGYSLLELFTPNNELIIQSHMLECINTKSSLAFIYVKSSNQEKRYYKWHITYAKDTERTILHCTIVDVTDSYVAPSNVTSVLDQFYELFDSSSVALCLIKVRSNRTIEVEKMNKRCTQMQQMLPYNPDSFPGYPVFESILINKKPIRLEYEYKISRFESIHLNMTLTPIIEQCIVTKIVASVVTDDFHPIRFHTEEFSLTPRERQILEYVGNGEKYRFIAYHLNISEGTVKKIVSNAYRKLNISSRTELIKKYFT